MYLLNNFLVQGEPLKPSSPGPDPDVLTILRDLSESHQVLFTFVQAIIPETQLTKYGRRLIHIFAQLLRNKY